ncbi:MAG: glycosyltransferase family 4 protein [Chthoniobacterales bacterium]
MIVLAHPTGNANVRAVLEALEQNKLLARFVTTIGWSEVSYPNLAARIRGKLRRNYRLPADKIDIHPVREIVRLLAGALRFAPLTESESAWANIDQVYQSLDREAARRLRHREYGPEVRGVYAYEDCAGQLFTAAAELGLKRIYDLPIAYWKTAQRLLGEEAERYPDWEPTLGGTRDSPAKLARKTREIALADVVICPSNFVLESLPTAEREKKQTVMAPFGSPTCPDRFGVVDLAPKGNSDTGPLRVLFAGAMTQRKGLADVFAAMKLVDSARVHLVVMGSAILPLDWYREQFADFIYEPPRPHADVLRLMRSCHVLVLPSIVEGRALVQQEAMACGLPVIVTRNAGGDDLIEEERTGFLVPIRSPEAVAEKVNWFAANRSRIAEMGGAAKARALEFTWRGYGERIAGTIRALIGL